MKFSLNTHQIAISLSQMLNALTGGYADEMLSSRCWRDYEKCFLCKVICGVMEIFEHDHCHKTYQAEHKRKQTSEYLSKWY